jgi:hypothetical protein
MRSISRAKLPIGWWSIPGQCSSVGVAGDGGTPELANGTGSIGNIDTGSFNNFQTLAIDGGANWTLNGVNT